MAVENPNHHVVTITTKKMVNGDVYLADFPVPGIARKITLERISMNYPARVTLYGSASARSKDANRLASVPPGNAAEFEVLAVFTIIDFDLTQPPRNPEAYEWLRQPYAGKGKEQFWQPVTINTDAGIIYVQVEARAGNAKTKINFEINFHLKDN